MKHYSFAGVHLLPNHPFPYNQRTYAAEGIELENIEAVYIVDMCGNRLQEITDYFTVVDNFNDTTTGSPQIIWQIKNCPYDAGFRLVYLEILSGENAPIYSTPFYFTNTRSEFTSRWDYKDKENDVMLSTGLQIYYRQSRHAKEASIYTSVSNNRSFNPSVKITPYEKWNSDVVDNLVLLEFDKIFLCKYRYSQQTSNDMLPVRTGLFEADDTPDFEADENFVQGQYSFTRDYTLTFDPNALPIVPPAPPVDPKTITIERLLRQGTTGVTYVYEIENYNNLPPEFIYQVSLDNVNWSNHTAGVPSGNFTITGIDNTQPYYYRIWDYVNGVYSNVIQLAGQTIELVEIGTFQTEFIPTGNTYQAFFIANNFTPTSPFTMEVSTDGTTWVTAGTTANVTSPRPVYTPASATEFTYFRMKYTPLGITSNVKQFDFD